MADEIDPFTDYWGSIFVGGSRQMNGIESIAAERKRQIEAEGWTAEHDDAHDSGEMAIAAAIYAAPGARDGLPAGERPRSKILPFWPWSSDWYKPKSRREDLVRAGALIAAEIDRLDRAAARETQA